MPSLLTPTKALVLLVRKKNRLLHFCQDSYGYNKLIPLITDLSEHRAALCEAYIFDRENKKWRLPFSMCLGQSECAIPLLDLSDA